MAISTEKLVIIWTWFLNNGQEVKKTCKRFKISRSSFYHYFKSEIRQIQDTGHKNSKLYTDEQLDTKAKRLVHEANGIKRVTKNLDFKSPDFIERTIDELYDYYKLRIEQKRIQNIYEIQELLLVATKRIKEDIRIRGCTKINPKLYEALINTVSDKEIINFNINNNQLALNNNANKTNNQATQLSFRDRLIAELGSDELPESIEQINNNINENNNIDENNNINNTNNIIEVTPENDD